MLGKLNVNDCPAGLEPLTGVRKSRKASVDPFSYLLLFISIVKSPNASNILQCIKFLTSIST